MDCWQINLQESLGGGEVYTAFLVRALDAAGVRSRVIVSRRATFWRRLLPETTETIAIAGSDTIAACLPANANWLLTHGGLAPALARDLAHNHLLTGIAHMPLYGRDPRAFCHHRLVIPVSVYVRESLWAGLQPAQVYEKPLYGVARLDFDQMQATEELRRRSCFEWDRRKGRDRIMGWVEPVVAPFLPRPVWTKKAGLTLGIVSRLTPIKQFPALLSALLPALIARPDVHLEVVGSGGYASVRDLYRVLRPLHERVRFWGHQTNVRAAYAKLDFLLTGLPEKEALGLNVIEAQNCGTPVIAVDAPPFTETVLHGVTGLLYADPRRDGGESFGRLLDEVARHPFHIDMPRAAHHLAQFSFEAFQSRVSVMAKAVLECRK